LLHLCYKIVTMARMTSKICLVCGKDFKGTAAKMTCSPACRTAMSRIFVEGKKPEYYFIAKSKGQKVPEFNEECTFVTASFYNRNDEDLNWDYTVWQIKKLDGEDEDGNPAWYWGLLTGDGEEWGPLEDLSADLYLILPHPPKDRV